MYRRTPVPPALARRYAAEAIPVPVAIRELCDAESAARVAKCEQGIRDYLAAA